MRVLLIYDIANDKARGKVADACADFGLDREQFSAFTGELSRTPRRSAQSMTGRLIRRR